MSMAHIVGDLIVHGEVEPGFEEVESAFQEKFATRGEIGAHAWSMNEIAKLSIFGMATRILRPEHPGKRYTLVLVFSATKGAWQWQWKWHIPAVCSTTAPVASYWPSLHNRARRLLRCGTSFIKPD